MKVDVLLSNAGAVQFWSEIFSNGHMVSSFFRSDSFRFGCFPQNDRVVAQSDRVVVFFLFDGVRMRIFRFEHKIFFVNIILLTFPTFLSVFLQQCAKRIEFFSSSYSSRS